MREIKFRAWDKKTKVMIYDIQDHRDCDDCLGERGGAKDFLEYGCENFGDFLNSDRFDVMQYTGLKDKNGKEIYEGDIVDLDSWAGTQQIVFIEGAFCLANEKGDYVGDIHYCQHAGRKQSEVIGNIYENPELLK